MKDQFERDHDPQKELALWERMPAAYQSFCGARELAPAAKHAVFCLLLLRSMTSEKDALKRAESTVLTREQAQEVLAGFKADLALD